MTKNYHQANISSKRPLPGLFGFIEPSEKLNKKKFGPYSAFFLMVAFLVGPWANISHSSVLGGALIFAQAESMVTEPKVEDNWEDDWDLSKDDADQGVVEDADTALAGTTGIEAEPLKHLFLNDPIPRAITFVLVLFLMWLIAKSGFRSAIQQREIVPLSAWQFWTAILFLVGLLLNGYFVTYDQFFNRGLLIPSTVVVGLLAVGTLFMVFKSRNGLREEI